MGKGTLIVKEPWRERRYRSRYYLGKMDLIHGEGNPKDFKEK